MGKRYRQTDNGDWVEVDEQAEAGAEAILYILLFIFPYALGMVIWAPFQMLAGELPFINDEWLAGLSILMPFIIFVPLLIYYACRGKILLIYILGACALGLILIDFFMFDKCCLTLYYKGWFINI